MPKFADTYTDEQRAAVVADALALGNRKEAVRRAAAGTLAAGLEPFTISYTYVCELVQEEQQRRDPAGTAARGKSAPELADDILKRELRRLDGQSRAGRLNAQKAREMLRALRELDALARKAPTPPAADPEQGDDQAPEPKPAGLIERLVEEERRREPERPDAGGDGSAGGSAGGDAHAGTTNTQEDAERTASAVRSRAETLRDQLAGV